MGKSKTKFCLTVWESRVDIEDLQLNLTFLESQSLFF